MSRHERDGSLKSIVKGLAERVLNCGGLLGLALLGLLMVIGVSFSIVHSPAAADRFTPWGRSETGTRQPWAAN